MANLLSTPHLKRQQHDAMARMLLASSIAILMGSTFAILGLLPAYFDIRVEHTGRSLVLETLQKPQQDDSASERTIVSGIRKRVAAFESLGKQQQFAAALLSVIESRPKGIAIRAVTYSHKDGAGVFQIRGVAPDSVAIKTYADSLRSSSLFTKVSVPLTALALSEGGGFSISIEGPF